MLGTDEHFPPPNAPEGLLTRVQIEKVGGLGMDVLTRHPAVTLPTIIATWLSARSPGRLFLPV